MTVDATLPIPSAEMPPAGLEDAVVSEAAGIFQEILSAYIKPLFHSAEIEGPLDYPSAHDGALTVVSDGVLFLHVPGHPHIAFALRRNAGFTSNDKKLLRSLLETLHHDPKGKLSHSVLCGAVEKAIANLISEEQAGTVLDILEVYSQWASETYEGRRMTHTVGLCRNFGRGEERSFYQLRNNPAIKALGGSRDTILVLDETGSVAGVENVSAKLNNYRKDKDILAPIDLADIAVWTTSSRRIAFHLMANGDILIFRDKQLVFAKRRSYWRGFPHKSILDQHFSSPYVTMEEKAKRAVYLTALDMAFSGRGGCIGIVQADSPRKAAYKLANENMLFFSERRSTMTSLLAAIAGDRKFPDIPRRIRAGFCSLDGATITDSQGNILAVGAILRTNGNPLQGGGRSAAARALAGYGFGIKISDDGFIEIYREDSTPLHFA